MSFLSQPITIQSFLENDRKFGGITVDVIIQEDTNDTLVITKQPVQTGTPITDHAYKEPTVLAMKIRLSENLSTDLSEIYGELLALQFPPVPFIVFTQKRIYENMLIASLGVMTDKYTENVLAIDITFQQVVLVNIATATVIPLSRQRSPEKTAPTQKTGRKSSAAKQGVDGFRRFFGG